MIYFLLIWNIFLTASIFILFATIKDHQKLVKVIYETLQRHDDQLNLIETKLKKEKQQ